MPGQDEEACAMRDCFHWMFNFIVLIAAVTSTVFAQNPIIRDQFTADPAARVFEGKVYLYPSHDILAREGRGRVGWFCMED